MSFFIPKKPTLRLFSQLIAKANHHHRFASTYKAALVKQFGQPLIIDSVKSPKLKAGEIRIGVYCCGINSLDLSNVDGELEPKPKLPFIPGYEVCGEVTEVGTAGADDEYCKLLKVGQRVIGLDIEHAGGFGEEITLQAKDAWAIDPAIDFGTGASLVNSYATALLALTRRASIQRGDTVMVTGAAGRLGLAVVDLAANVYRCKVIGVCQSEDKATLVRDRGAWATVTIGKQDLATQVKKITNGEGISIIIDSVGGDLFKELIKCVADEGKIIVAGFASKKIPQITTSELLDNSFSILGVNLEQYRNKKFSVYREAVSDVIQMCEDKLIKPMPSKHYKLEQINEALGILRDGKSLSKLVLDVK